MPSAGPAIHRYCFTGEYPTPLTDRKRRQEAFRAGQALRCSLKPKARPVQPKCPSDGFVCLLRSVTGALSGPGTSVIYATAQWHW